MAQRLRLFDMKLSSLPVDSGICQSDTVAVANIVNACQERLLYCKEAGDESWFGTFAEMAFTVSRTQPYLTLPREVARLEMVDVCDRPRPVQNQLYEYLRFGNGRMPKTFRCQNWCGMDQIYTRNVVPTFTDLTSPPQLLRVYMTDPVDFGKRILLQGTDANGQTIYSQDGLNQVSGEYVYLRQPFSTSLNQFSTITGIQKDMTMGSVQLFQVGPSTGAQVLLLTMEPSETTAAYRRYLFNPLPNNCCSTNVAGDVQVTAIVKLDLIPVQVDTDYCLITCKEALVCEAQSYRYSKVDSKSAQALSIKCHQDAVRLLNGQLSHFLGINEPAVIFKPFGSAALSRQRIGLLQ